MIADVPANENPDPKGVFVAISGCHRAVTLVS
jgi:hypothetical protein